MRSINEVLMANSRANASPKRKNNTINHHNDDENRLKKVPKLFHSGVDDVDITNKLKTLLHKLKEPPSTFDPKCITDCWTGGVPFAFMCLACELISEEQGKRTSIIEIACNMLRTAMCCSSKDLLAVLCLVTYKLAPAHQVGVSDQLGIGEPCLIRAVSEAYGIDESKLKTKTKEIGDLGLVAESGAARLNQLKLAKHKGLTVSKVYDTFRLIAEISGKSSKNKKRDLVKELLVAAHDCEPKYLIRLLLPKRGMRIKCAESTFLDALGQAVVYYFKNQSPPTIEEASKIVRQAYAAVPVFDRIVTVLMSEGLWKLQETCKLSPGIPIDPMLAKAVRSVSEVVDKFKGMEYTCEYKYDGERGQVHYMSEETERVEIYSRNLERSTEKFPDVVETVSRLKNTHVKSFILDCEIVAYDRVRHRVLPFQELSTRGRKNVKVDNIKVDACIFAFDLLYLNGESLLQEPLAVRRKHLYAAFTEEAGVLRFPTSITSRDPAEIQKFFKISLHESFEGIVVKSLNVDAQYEPGKRRWLKLKRDSVESLWDSLDLVPIGADYGTGKRAGVYGTFLLACYDCESGEFQSICKAGSGLSDEELEDLYKRLSSKVIPKPLPNYKHNEQKVTPDVWFEPTEVLEVKAGGLTISSVYSAAYDIVCPDKGLSLRNPTINRIRLDKDPRQATSSDQVAEMYREQGEKSS